MRAAGEFGVRVQATADQEADRVFTISINGDEVETGDVGDNGEIDECVPVPDNTENDDAAPSTLTLRVDSTAMGGFDDAERTINVHKLSVTNAPEAPLQTAMNCASTGFGYNFMVEVDASLGDADFTFTSGAGSVSGTVRTWNAASGKPLGKPMLYPAGVQATAFSPDAAGQYLLIGYRDGCFRLWDRSTGRTLGPTMWHRTASTRTL